MTQKPISQFDLNEAKRYRDELTRALTALGEKLGVTFDVGSIKYTPHVISCKLSAAVKETKNGVEIESVEAAAFLRECFRFGFDPDDLNKEVIHLGVKYKIIGLAPRKHKNPVILRDLDGRVKVAPASVVRALLVKQR